MCHVVSKVCHVALKCVSCCIEVCVSCCLEVCVMLSRMCVMLSRSVCHVVSKCVCHVVSSVARLLVVGGVSELHQRVDAVRDKLVWSHAAK